MFFQKRHPPAGSRPGTLMIPETALPPAIRVIDYTEESVTETEVSDVEDLRLFVESDSVSWIDVQGLGDERTIRRIGELFSLHALALEDAVNVPQRPKSESYEKFQLFITRMTRLEPIAQLQVEQVSIFLGARYVLTLQEKHGDNFGPVRARIRAGIGPMRRSGPDYLAYALIDTVIDGYYPVIEGLGEYLEELEAATLTQHEPGQLRKVYDAKRQLLELRRAVWPQREAINSLIRDENPLVGDTVRIFLRDCYDHAVQIIDVTETYRELSGSLMDLYLNTVSQRTNEIMKVLTIMASIFIPLTFMAGIYGMNFEHMPELARPWAYPALLVAMAAVGAGLLLFFRRRGWLGRPEVAA
ncbi:MAG: magnesium/cobalt transporter CorA [Gemmatimonadota bacterium]|nr:MAG: magnesium/cobalt transporter CorA [Gemmatimonadota bacterium]